MLVKAVRGTCSKSIFSALHSNYPPPRSLHEFMLHADTRVSIKCNNQRVPAMYVDFIHPATRKKKSSGAILFISAYVSLQLSQLVNCEGHIIDGCASCEARLSSAL